MTQLQHVVYKGDEDYQQTLDSMVWNAMKPDRQPSVIVRAASAEDVQAAVKLAEDMDVKIKVRSGGHSWTASSVRDDSMLIDVSGLDELSIDLDRNVATAGPGAQVEQVMSALAKHDLFFPVGHCPSVALGGYLLQGGWGWNSRALGIGCTNVQAIDIVTPDGELIHASGAENPEWFWAARGSGSGFFGIVVGYHLDLHPYPQTILTRQDVYPAECGEEVLKWAFDLQQRLPREIEWFVFCTRPSAGKRATYRVEAVSFLADETTAKAALAIFESCPVLDQAVSRTPVHSTTMPKLLSGSNDLYVEGYRWAGDNAWFDDTPDELASALVKAADLLPPWPSHLVIYGWPQLSNTDSVFSMSGKIYACAISGWNNAADDAHLKLSSARAMQVLEPYSKGMGLADEGLLYRAANTHSPENSQTLESLRAEFDRRSRMLDFLTRGGH